MRHFRLHLVVILLASGISTQAICFAAAAESDKPAAKSALQRIEYDDPDLVVDLGVGLWAWPIPMDFDDDGDLDLVVSCPDVPYKGTYFFENPGGNNKLPVFKAGKRIGQGTFNIMPSYVGRAVRILMPGREVVEMAKNASDGKALAKTVKLPLKPNIHANKVRANQWRYADYDGDGLLDLIVGVGDWKAYGWDDAFNAQGQWTRGPLHGYVYWLRNLGTADKSAADKPTYDKPIKIEAGGRPIDVYGMPSPNLADFDGDGDLDIVCGEFVDRLTYFQNVGTRNGPKYAAGRFLKHDGGDLRMDLCMIVPVAIDWDRDGDIDLIVSQEDGRVALVENTGKSVDDTPVFLPPQFFQQEAGPLKFGSLVTPFGCDWDGDGDEDLLCGNAAGYIGFIENLGQNPHNKARGGCPVRLAAPKYLTVDGQPIRIVAGPNGSIQGPCESKWGYTTLSVADWDGDGLPDIVVNSIWGKVVWFKNIGTRSKPKLAAARPIEVQWPGKTPKPDWFWWQPEGKSLATQWRTTPFATDYNRDGLCDLVMLDREGYLSLFKRAKQANQLVLLPPERVFANEHGKPLQLNSRRVGSSGRRKFCLVDWDRDGRVDVLLNGRNVEFLRNEKDLDGRPAFKKMGLVDQRRLAGHTTSPTVVDWNGDSVPDLVVGGEDGHLYYLRNPNTTKR